VFDSLSAGGTLAQRGAAALLPVRAARMPSFIGTCWMLPEKLRNRVGFPGMFLL